MLRMNISAEHLLKSHWPKFALVGNLFTSCVSQVGWLYLTCSSTYARPKSSNPLLGYLLSSDHFCRVSFIHFLICLTCSAFSSFVCFGFAFVADSFWHCKHFRLWKDLRVLSVFGLLAVWSFWAWPTERESNVSLHCAHTYLAVSVPCQLALTVYIDIFLFYSFHFLHMLPN